MSAVTGVLPADDEGWAFEPKWDGMRCVVELDHGRVRAWTRTDREVSASFPELAELATIAPVAVLDGEVVAFDGDRPSFSRLQQRMGVADADVARRRGVPVTYVVFDVPQLQGVDLRAEPLATRRQVLAGSFEFGDALALNAAVVGDGEALFEALRAHQRGATEAGQAMTKALADTVAQVIGIPWVSDDAVTLLMRHLLGDDTAEMMGVPESSKIGALAMSGIVSVVRAASTVGEGIGDEVPLVHRISAWFGQRFVERIARRDRGGERSLFHLPADLREAWER